MTVPVGRRSFMAGMGGFICTMAGHKISANEHVDLDKLAAELKVPPAVLEGRSAKTSVRANAAQAPNGTTREYWIKAEKVKWNIVPTHHDAVMDKHIGGKVTFKAYAYRAYSSGFAQPLGPATIPGPLIECEVGDTVLINFRNETGVPVTMHPHGVFYANNMDGAYKGKYTTASGFVRSGETFQYVWQAHPGTEGAWFYHDHGPLCPLPVFKGLFGSLIVREPGAVLPDNEFFLCFHSFVPAATNLNNTFMCVNGKAYAGNTPTLHATVGQTTTFHVYALDDNFHSFHLHGHRWTDPDGGNIVDNRPLGPGDILTASFVEDNPGQWLYHCHVFSHMMMGMIGWYMVSE
jgi:manganese oxidase